MKNNELETEKEESKQDKIINLQDLHPIELFGFYQGYEYGSNVKGLNYEKAIECLELITEKANKFLPEFLLARERLKQINEVKKGLEKIEENGEDELDLHYCFPGNLIIENLIIQNIEASLISEFLKTNKTVKTFRFVQPLDKALEIITEGLEKNRSVTHLTINIPLDKGFAALASSLEKNHTVNVLSLSTEKIHFKAAKTLSELIKNNSSLLNLLIDCKVCNDEAETLILEALEENYSLVLTKFLVNKKEDEWVKETVNRNIEYQHDFFKAVAAGNEEEVLKLLNINGSGKGVAINGKFGNPEFVEFHGKTAIQVALEKNNLDMVATLIANGANLSIGKTIFLLRYVTKNLAEDEKVKTYEKFGDTLLQRNFSKSDASSLFEIMNLGAKVNKENRDFFGHGFFQNKDGVPSLQDIVLKRIVGSGQNVDLELKRKLLQEMLYKELHFTEISAEDQEKILKDPREEENKEEQNNDDEEKLSEGMKQTEEEEVKEERPSEKPNPEGKNFTQLTSKTNKSL